jgi:hypothetical protein
MKCLQDCCRENPAFRKDLQRMKHSLATCNSPLAACCKPARPSRKKSLQSR